MATDLERLVVQLSADIKGYENAMNRAQGVTNKTVRNIQNQFARSNRNLTGQFSALSKSFAAAFVGGVSLAGAQQLIDTSIRIQNALKLAGLEGTALSDVYDKLFASAQRNAAPIEALVTLYGRMSVAQSELHATQEELLQFSDLVAMSIRAGGQSATEASGALLQLSQALGGGKIQAEEYNSLIDGARPLLQAVAAGLEEAGGSVSKLTALVKDGKVSSEAFFRAGQAGAYVLEEQLAGAESTVSQAFVRLQNVLIDTAGEINEGSGASEKLVSALDSLASMIESTDFGPIISGVVDFGNAVIQTVGYIEGLAKSLGELTGANNVGKFVYGQLDQQKIQSRIDGAFEGTVAEKGDRVGDAGGPLEITVDKGKRQTVSLKDYTVPGGDKKKGGSKGRKSRQDDFAREVSQIKERTAATLAETKALASLNPLVDDYGYAVEKAKTEQDLLTAAQKAGKAVTPELKAQIETLSEAYAQATVEAEKLQEAHEQARERVQEFNALARDTLGGFIQDLRNGVSGAEALKNAIGRLADSFLNSGLEALFSSKPGKSSGGIFGSIFSGLGSLFGGGFTSTPNGFAKTLGLPGFASGTANTGGMTGQVRGLVHGNEAVIPLPNGGKVPVALQAPQLPRFNSAGGGAQTIKVEVAADVDNSGNIMPLVTKVADERAGTAVAQGQQQAQRTFPAMQADRQRRYS